MYYSFMIVVMSTLFGISRECNDFSKVTSAEKKYELIGLFPVNVTGKVETEVLIWSEAFRYFIERSNQRYGDIFYYRMYDLCWNEDYDLMTNVTMDIILEAGNSLQSNVCACVPRNYELYETLGIVGAANSFNTEYISTVVRTEDITLISYASTNEQLSDKTLYPNVLRTIPADSYQSNAINDLLRRMNWTYISLIFEDTSYGLSGQRAVASSDSCISVEISLPSGILSSSTIKSTFETLNQDTRSKVIVLWGQFGMIKSILESAPLYDFHDRVWIMSDASGRNPWFLDMSKSLSGHFFHIIPFSGESKEFQDHFFNLTYEDSLNSASWLRHFFQQQTNVTKTTSLKQYSHLFDFSLVGFVRNSVISYVETLVKLLKVKCPPFLTLESCNISLSLFFDEYITALKSDTYVGLDGQYFSYDVNGDVNATAFKIYSIDTAKNDFFLFGSWSSQKHLYEVNEELFNLYSAVRSDCNCDRGTTPSKGPIACCPTCISCSGNKYYKPGIGNSECRLCPEDQVATVDKTGCRFLKYSHIETFAYEAIVIFVVSFSGVVLLFFTVFFYLNYRSTPVIRSSNFQLSLLQLLSHACVFTLPLLFIGQDTKLKCQIRTYGSCFFFVFVVVISLMKITHMVKIFNVRHRLSKSEILQQRTYELLILVVSMAVDILLAVILSSLVPLEVNEETNGTKIIYSVCTDAKHYLGHVVYILLLQLICGVQSFRGRHLPAKYNEAKYTSFSMFTSMLILILAVPLTSSMDNHNTHQLLQACSVLLANWVLFLSSYSYRVIIILFYPSMNTNEVFHRKRLRSVMSNVTFTTMAPANRNTLNELQINNNLCNKRSISDIVSYNERLFWESGSVSSRDTLRLDSIETASTVTNISRLTVDTAAYENHAYQRDPL